MKLQTFLFFLFHQIVVYNLESTYSSNNLNKYIYNFMSRMYIQINDNCSLKHGCLKFNQINKIPKKD